MNSLNASLSGTKFSSAALTGKPALAGSVSIAAAPQVAVSKQPKFGNALLGAKLAGVDVLSSSFEKIVEVFLWGFLIKDVVGMWLPRLGVSLQRGSVKYDPNSDPQTKDLPLKDQVRKTVTENVKGLNWVNFIEDTGREMVSGPGTLLVPSVMFALARRTQGRAAVTLGNGPLKELSTGFQQHLSKLPDNHFLATATGDALKSPQYKEAFRKELANYLYSTLSSDALKSAKLTDKAFANVDAFAKDWTDRFTKQVFDVNAVEGLTRVERKEAAKAAQAGYTALQQEFREIMVDEYGQKIRLGRELAEARKKGGDLSKLMASDRIEAKIGTHSASEFVETISRWKDFSTEVLREKIKVPDAKLGDVSEGLYKKIVAKKGLMALSATVLGAIYLFKMAKWVQSHDQYPGERLNSTGAPGAPAAPAAAPVKTGGIA